MIGYWFGMISGELVRLENLEVLGQVLTALSDGTAEQSGFFTSLEDEIELLIQAR